MTEKRYYETIERYNQIIEDLQFSPLTHSVEEVFQIQESIDKQVRRMLAMLDADKVAYSQASHYTKLAEIEHKTQCLRKILEDVQYGNIAIADYEGTYISNPYPSFFVFMAAAFILLGLVRIIS